MSDTQSRYKQQAANARRNRWRIIFMGILLATLPFYCVGTVAYFLAPVQPDPTATPRPATETPADGVTVTAAATEPLAATVTDAPTLRPTITQPFGVPATAVPRVTNTVPPTNTPPPSATPTDAPPTNTPPPSATPTTAITDTPLPFLDG